MRETLLVSIKIFITRKRAHSTRYFLQNFIVQATTAICRVCSSFEGGIKRDNSLFTLYKQRVVTPYC